MGKHSEKQNEASTVKSQSPGGLNSIIVIRLIVASLIFAVSLIVKMPSLVRILLLALSVVVSGYDVALDAVNSVESGDYFATPIVIVFVAVISFFIGFGLEGAALMMFYQIGQILIAYAQERTVKSAKELLCYSDEETVEKVTGIIEEENAGKMAMEYTVGSAASFILKIALGIAVLYAVLIPILTNLSFAVSIHRALTIIVIATPLSVVVAMPLTGIIGICYGAQFGVIFNNAAAMEKAAEVETAVFDKPGVFADDHPSLVSAQSDLLDKSTFMNFAAHAVYYSEQPFAKAISDAFNLDYKLDLISDFQDIPGCGVDLKINGAHVTLATRELFASRGEAVPYENAKEDYQMFYMMVSEKYVGKIALTNEIYGETEQLAPDLKAIGFDKCILLTEDGKEESEAAATELEFDEVYGECDTERKLRLVNDLKASRDTQMMYVYANGFDAHSAADLDIRVSRKGKFADILVIPEYIANLPLALQLCSRVREVAAENAIFAFVIKAILIFLSLTGYCNIWFAIFIDMAAALATILNSIRVTSPSLIGILKYKAGK
ncbi:MAG: HAD family hydrolase [Candidatus Limivicinus sp.]|nr:HAD family hydrolase [Candidatus Limivicinus sp.]